MKKTDDRWELVIREKLDDYEVKPGDGLWRRIEAEMPKPRRRFVPLFWRAVAAAACIAVVAGAYFFVSDSVRRVPGSPTGSESVVASADSPVLTDAVTEDRKEAESAVVLTATGMAENGLVAAVRASEPAAVPLPENDSEPVSEVATKESADSIDDCRLSQAALTKAFVEADVKPSGNKTRNQARSVYVNKNASSSRWQVAVSVTYGLTGQGSSSADGFSPLFDTRFGEASMPPMMTAPTGRPSKAQIEEARFRTSYYKVLAKTIDSETATDDVYRLPLVYSATFRYMITRRWGINAGLSYSNVSSERRSGSGTDYYTTEQRMHFLGLPVNVSYTFLDTRFLTLYAMAGGRVEKCLSATRRDVVVSSMERSAKSRKEDLDARPWQGSLDLGVGAQFNFSSHYGLFVEPGLVYDLSGKKSLPIRRRNDFGFQLSLGLRVSY